MDTAMGITITTDMKKKMLNKNKEGMTLCILQLREE